MLKNLLPGISLYTKLFNFCIILPTTKPNSAQFNSASREDKKKKKAFMTMTPFTKEAKPADRKWQGPDFATFAYSRELNLLKH